MILLFQIVILCILLATITYMMTISYLVYRGCNYLPSPKKDIDAALSVLRSGDVFIDLGFGNGVVMQAAARKKARTVIGYELDFTRIIHTWWNLRRDKYPGYQFKYADIWSADLSPADVVFTYFTIRHMRKLYTKAKKEMKKGSWFISQVHEIPGIKPTKQIGNVRFYKM
jgi:hypothetical protein